MGFLDRIFKSREQENEENDLVTTIPEKSESEKPKFVADISLYEFENVNWAEFGSVLKQNRILPNSYIKKPAGIDVKLSKKGQPMVLLTFHSATSSSVREFLLLQDEVFQSVNGAIDDGKNQDLIRVWNKFKDEIRYRNMIYTNREGHFHKMEAERMIKKAERMKKLDNIYELEQAFLEIYKDAKFDDFCHTFIKDENNLEFSNYFPAFISLLKEPINGNFRGEPAVPFSPKTLEHCILHMTNSEKAHHGEYVNDFERMCRKLQEASCYESEDWDKVIEIGKAVVKQAYQVSVLQNGKE